MLFSVVLVDKSTGEVEFSISEIMARSAVLYAASGVKELASKLPAILVVTATICWARFSIFTALSSIPETISSVENDLYGLKSSI